MELLTISLSYSSKLAFWRNAKKISEMISGQKIRGTYSEQTKDTDRSGDDAVYLCVLSRILVIFLRDFCHDVR